MATRLIWFAKNSMQHIHDNANVPIDVDRETIDKVNSFKYLGAIKTSTGSCSEDVKARIGRTKKATMELDTIWKDRGLRK